MEVGGAPVVEVDVLAGSPAVTVASSVANRCSDVDREVDTACPEADTRSCAPCSTVAPAGTSVLMNMAPTATAAPEGTTTARRTRRHAPRWIGCSTNVKLRKARHDVTTTRNAKSS